MPSGSSGSMLHLEVAPAPPAAATAQATARRILSGVRVQYIPSGQVARRLHMSSRTLGKLTREDGFDTPQSFHIRQATICCLDGPKGIRHLCTTHQWLLFWFM